MLIFAVFGLLIVLPILYILSIGPLIWLADRNYVSRETAQRIVVIYEPLQWPSSRCQPLKDFIGWYQSLFRS